MYRDSHGDTAAMQQIASLGSASQYHKSLKQLFHFLGTQHHAHNTLCCATPPLIWACQAARVFLRQTSICSRERCKRAVVQWSIRRVKSVSFLLAGERHPHTNIGGQSLRSATANCQVAVTSMLMLMQVRTSDNYRIGKHGLSISICSDSIIA